jgi:hypothetical protein
VRCHKYWRAARTAAGQRGRCRAAGGQGQLGAWSGAAAVTVVREGVGAGAGRGQTAGRGEVRLAEVLAAGCGLRCGVQKASRSAWRRPESVEAKRRWSGMAVAAITTHRGRPTSLRAGPNPNQSRRFHSIASPARAWHGRAPASANAATPSGPPFCRSSRLVARLAVGRRHARAALHK